MTTTITGGLDDDGDEGDDDEDDEDDEDEGGGGRQEVDPLVALGLNLASPAVFDYAPQRQRASKSQSLVPLPGVFRKLHGSRS